MSTFQCDWNFLPSFVLYVSFSLVVIWENNVFLLQPSAATTKDTTHEQRDFLETGVRAVEPPCCWCFSLKFVYWFSFSLNLSPLREMGVEWLPFVNSKF